MHTKINEQIKLVNIPCPRCGFEESIILYNGRDYLYNIPGIYSVSVCKKCSFWFQNPRPADDQLAKCYPVDYMPHLKPDKSSSEQQNKVNESKENSNNWLKNFIRKVILKYQPKNYLHHHLGYRHLSVNSELGLDWRLLTVFDWFNRWLNGVFLTPDYIQNGKLLEIGVGRGKRLIELRRNGWKDLYGIELVPHAAEQAKAEGFSVECGSVEDILPDHYPDNFFDVIITSMVLEHLSNPFEVIKQISVKLKPGGQFLFSTVCRDSLDAKMYGVFWGGFDFPRHLVYFKKEDLLEAIKDDFENLKCFYQVAPIDFVRSASWRNKPIDKIVRFLASSPVGDVLSISLAFLKLTSRISFKCRKKI